MENITAPCQDQEKKSFRDLSSFGTRIEYWVIGEMLRQGLDVYRPLVDDMGIDAIIRKKDGSFLELQIKAASEKASAKEPALFADIKCEQRGNYWFIFYAAQVGEKGTIWLMTAEEFREHASQNARGKSIGKWTIRFTGIKNGIAYANPKYEKYVCHDFSFCRLIKHKI